MARTKKSRPGPYYRRAFLEESEETGPGLVQTEIEEEEQFVDDSEDAIPAFADSLEN